MTKNAVLAAQVPESVLDLYALVDAGPTDAYLDRYYADDAERPSARRQWRGAGRRSEAGPGEQQPKHTILDREDELVNSPRVYIDYSPVRECAGEPTAKGA